jgi:plasmid stabilization system protein ParE
VIVEFDPDARAELIAGRDYYEARRPDYGSRFVFAIEQTVARIAATPAAAGIWPQSPPELPIRRRQVPGFPSSWLAYVAMTDRIYILAIVHTRRHPDHWLKRARRAR